MPKTEAPTDNIPLVLVKQWSLENPTSIPSDNLDMRTCPNTVKTFFFFSFLFFSFLSFFFFFLSLSHLFLVPPCFF
jgi:hypothetical protein